MWAVLVLTVMGIQVASSFQIGASDNKFLGFSDKQILDYLLDKSKYDKRMRPVDKTVVNVTVLLLTLSSPDESSLKYEVEFLLHQKWYDPRLKFDDAGKHRYLNGLLHTENIWLPDTYFIKHGEFKYPLIPVHIALRIYPNGSVIYSMRRSMVLNCQGNLHIFPFDNLKCPFALESVSHENNEVELQWSETEQRITGATSLRQQNAYLVKNVTGECGTQHTWRGNYSCLRVLLVFTRDKSFYISTVFVPGVVLVTSSFISFWLDINAVPARVMIGVTTMLNFCTTTNGFRSTLPVVSNLTAMNLWDGVCMFFIYASMLEFIIVNYLYRKLPGTSGGRPVSAPVPESLKNPSLAQTNSRRVFSDTNVQQPTQPQQTPATTPNAVLPPAATEPPAALNHRLQSDKARAAASVFAWLRRPQLFVTPDSRNRQRLAKQIDNVSKGVFPLLFGIFTVGFVLTFAVIKPSQQENFILL
ncbi:glutamate-gated chloride channel [Parasteatoda tepidariorum]|uniref:glutamate-gated chloride channel n=1 Tax=Parasteatoda tepidariorum TaxID=114398 RepID=UPI001C71942D|nr:glutamate-gated chloride channel [Parasteatoda tepidariorum]